jgi:hypothetical protein
MASLTEMLGLNKEQVEVEAQDVKSGFLLESNVYKMIVDKVYVKNTDSGARMFTAEMLTEDNKKFTFSTCVMSGDEKGNKNTYTDKNGKERPLPGVIQMGHFFQAVEVDILKAQAKEATIEAFGENIKVDAIPEVTGKKLIVGVFQYENEWNNKVTIKNDVKAFLKEDGTNNDGKDLIDSLKNWIEKNPLKKLKNKSSASSAATTGGSENSKPSSGWSV